MTRVILGVTGHRLLAQAGTEACVQQELLALKRFEPGVRFRVVTSLAEGADRLIAKAACETLGADLIAVLPMPAAAFENDFESERSVRDFRNLLRSAAKVVVAPMLSTGRAWRSSGEERNHQYAWATAYVARSADILIALWDGKPARGTGGTAYAVDWFRRGTTPRAYAMSRYTNRTRARKRRLIHINSIALAVRRSRYPA